MTQLTVPSRLSEILDTAARRSADTVTLEYDSAGVLEVTYFVGQSGIGLAVSERKHAQQIISELVDRAGLEKADRGRLRIESDGRAQVVRVSVRDHFGDSAFDLAFGPRSVLRSDPGARRSSTKKPGRA